MTTTTDINKRGIVINTFQYDENVAIRFQSILLDGEEENAQVYENKLYDEDYEYKNEKYNEQFLFKSQDGRLFEEMVSKNSSIDNKYIDSNGKESYNLFIIFNTSYGLGRYIEVSHQIKTLEEGFKKISKKNLNLKFAIVIISNKTMYEQELNENDTLESQEKQESEIMEFIAKYKQYIADEHVLKIGHYSNKHFQKQYVIDTICEIFSSNSNESTISKLNLDFKQFNQSNNSNILDILVEKFYTVKYNSIELYELLNGIEYTNIENKFTKQEEQLLEKDSIIYFNLKQLYKIATIESNISILLWLDQLLNIDQSTNKEEIDEMINYGGIEGFMNRVAKSGDLSLFKLLFKKSYNYDFSRLVDKGINQTNDQILNRGSYGVLDITRFFYWSEFSFLVDGKSMDIIEWLLSECVEKQCDKEIFKTIQTVILLKSAYNGDLDMFKFILSHEHSLVKVDSCLSNTHLEDNITSIHWASVHGNLNIIKYIYEELKFDIKSNLKTAISKCEPIHIAAYYHHKDLVDYIIDNKISNINVEMTNGETALSQAAWFYFNKKCKNSNDKYIKRLNVSKSFCDYLINHHGATKNSNYDKVISQSSTCNIL